MKKIIISTLLLSSLVLARATTASAADSNANTKGDIQFKDGKGSDKGPDDPGDKTDPTDPEIPDEIEEPEDGGDKTDGPLRFVYVPNLKFGDNNMIQVKGNSNYYAKYPNVQVSGSETKEERANFFEVEDTRGGAKGWTVSLSHDGVFETADKKHKMNANLYINDMSIRTNSSIEEAPTVKNDKVGTDINNYLKISTADTSDVEIVRAEEGFGFGSWSVRMGSTTTPIQQEVNNGDAKNKEYEKRNPAVMLEVLPGMKVADATYTTDLNWTLSNVL